MLPRLMRRALHYAPSREAAEDLAQEALMRVWAQLASEAQIDDIERYLFVALRNLARRQPRAMDALDEASMPLTDDSSAQVIAGEVLEAMDALPPEQASVLRAHAVEGRSYAEIADRDGLPIGTVMSRAARGRARLRKRLGLAGRLQVEEFLATGS